MVVAVQGCIADGTMPERTPEPFHPDLEQVTAKLKGALEEACVTDVEQADTGELIRIEEMLAIANDAAKQAISVRRRISQGTKRRRSSGGHREIEDQRGIRWIVFAIHPSSERGTQALSERYRGGWLTFDSGAETRRVAPIPNNWEHMSDAELATLCGQGEVAPPRKNRLRGNDGEAEQMR